MIPLANHSRESFADRVIRLRALTFVLKASRRSIGANTFTVGVVRMRVKTEFSP